jgi:hypothetical protein
MKKILVIICSIIYSQGFSFPPLYKLITPECSCEDSCNCDPCFCGLSYFQMREKAIKDNKPLIIFLNQKIQKVDGCYCVRMSSFYGADRVSIVVGIPDENGDMDRIVDFYGHASSTRILDAIKTWKIRNSIENKRISFNKIRYSSICVGGS